MPSHRGLKRVNFYVDPERLERVARELECRPADVIRRLIDNYLLANDIDEIRQRPGPGPTQVFRLGSDYELEPLPEGIEIEPVE
ncbi:MAG: hypothetical protein M1274_11870 [Actinobacteria bacterium]|nr:hypothetical protein [Actinomycetota bacterium]